MLHSNEKKIITHLFSLFFTVLYIEDNFNKTETEVSMVYNYKDNCSSFIMDQEDNIF